MIEDVSSVKLMRQGSWTEPSSSVVRDSKFTDKAVIVYQNTDKSSGEGPVPQLLAKARVVLPALMNYLYFSSAQVAVVYFGKGWSPTGEKVGLEGMEDLKVRMIRFLTTEIWPPLLRTDAPDESLGGDVLSHSVGPMDNITEEERQDAKERSWFKKSVESNMQVLLYLKRGAKNTKYMKLVLTNTARRLHFDVIDAREEKYRWDLRMLYTRIMDNLETQKAIDSYESYEHFFKQACEVASRYAVELERPLQPMVCVHVWEVNGPGGYTSQPCETDKDTVEKANPNDELYDVLEQRSDSDSAAVGDDAGGSVLTEKDIEDAKLKKKTTSTGKSSPVDGAPVDFFHPPLLSSFTCENQYVTRADLNSNPSPAFNCVPCTAANPPYKWMDSLDKPESATLDYKSYFSHTASEIKYRCVKFMCGFLNAYREGMLVIGVHEMPRLDNKGRHVTDREDKSIIQHNDLINQYVVGVRITQDELLDVQQDVSRQLLECIPPIPPQTVHIDCVPVVFPKNMNYSNRILILFDCTNTNSRDSLKQKCNYAMRFLYERGLSIIPLSLSEHRLETMLRQDLGIKAMNDDDDDDDVPVKPEDKSATLMSDDAEVMSPCTTVGDGNDDDPYHNFRYLKAEAYAIATIYDPAQLENVSWEKQLHENLSGPRSRCRHAFVDFPEKELGPLRLPPLYVVKVSVKIQRCGFLPLVQFNGKFFNGWPSIPIWDPATKTVRRVERNYNVYKSVRSVLTSRGGASIGSVDYGSIRDDSAGALSPMDTRTATSTGGVPAKVSNFQRTLERNGWLWFCIPQIVSRILSFLYDHNHVDPILRFRLVHPMFNFVFENRQGIHLIQMISSTPFGVPTFTIEANHISRVQNAFVHSRVPPIPLILCRVYEVLGNLPSPYPYVFVPLVQQSFRIAAFLIPVFYRQHYFDGQMRIAVVLDLRDGVLKTVTLKDGNLLLDPVVGMGFEPLNKRQVAAQLGRQGKKDNPNNLFTQIGKKSLFDPPSPKITQPQGFIANRCLWTSEEVQRSRSLTASCIVSPHWVDSSMAQTAREVEPNIPIIHFQFLTGDILEERHLSYLVKDDLPFAGSGNDRRWTVQHLLVWMNALLADPDHFRFFGYCNRSIAFHITELHEVCADDVEKTAQEYIAEKKSGHDRPITSDMLLCKSSEECCLHRKMKEWMKGV